MKSLVESAGLPSVQKISVNDAGHTKTYYWGRPPVPRSDGSVGKDKTVGLHSKPGAKEKARNANRSQNKRARQVLKRDLNEQRTEG